CCVQVLISERAGVGKSLAVRRLTERLIEVHKPMKDACVTVPLAEKKVDVNAIVSVLGDYITKPVRPDPKIFHLDITPAVQQGVDNLLFNLLVLGGITDTHGRVWRRYPWDLYMIEVTAPSQTANTAEAAVPTGRPETKVFYDHQFYTLLPTRTCRSPRDTLELESSMEHSEELAMTINDPLMDNLEFTSNAYQRAYQYLKRHSKGANLDYYDYEEGTIEDNHATCLPVLLRHCGVLDPSWAELRYFVWFLNEQLNDCESSVFCNPMLVGDASLNGFKSFVVKFMVRMSKDFATPSLQMSDESTACLQIDMDNDDDDTDDDIAAYQLRRRWESSPHPYIFFNNDHVSMTFLGFVIDQNGSLVDPSNNQIIEPSIMTREVKRGLEMQGVNLKVRFDDLTRDDKINQLCQVMGIEWAFDPDETYELTTDNVKKILAIHMRFRCGIPVIIMGETGCGKTRLIRFMCHYKQELLQ
ncbi:E3 ubiquitin-protein ligase rnf213-alpha-like, partial [Saccoglossus kowalevskii]